MVICTGLSDTVKLSNLKHWFLVEILLQYIIADIDYCSLIREDYF